MGFNTAMMIQNDHLSMIEKDPEFGRRVADAIREVTYRAVRDVTHRPEDYHFTRGFNVLPSHHADGMLVCVVGGNTIKLLGMGFSWDDDAILRDLAAQRGYRLVRKTVKTPA